MKSESLVIDCQRHRNKRLPSHMVLEGKPSAERYIFAGTTAVWTESATVVCIPTKGLDESEK